MEIRVVVFNKGEAGEFCEVYEHKGDSIRIELTEQKEIGVAVEPLIDEAGDGRKSWRLGNGEPRSNRKG